MAREFPFQAVIFDMDGVIVDSEAHYWRELRDFSRAFALDVSVDELDAQVGQSHQAFQRNLASWLTRAGRGPVTPGEAVALYDEWAADYPRDYRALLNADAQYAIDALKELGVRMALASSSPLENINQVLSACSLSDVFEVIVSGEQFHESKPEPDIYLHTLDKLGLPASACCCVEDSVPGITAGRRAGLTVFAKREDRFGFSQDAADAILDRVDDILEVAPRLFGSPSS